jgi:hypothetical protein
VNKRLWSLSLNKSKFPLHNLHSYSLLLELIRLYWRNTTVQISLHAKSVGYKFSKTFVLTPCPTNGNPHIQFYTAIPIGLLVITVKRQGGDYPAAAISPLCVQQIYYVNECYMLHRCLLPQTTLLRPTRGTRPMHPWIRNLYERYGVGCRPAAERSYQIS